MWLICTVIVIGIQVFYLMTYYCIEKEERFQIQEEIHLTYLQIEDLEKQMKSEEKIEERLEELTTKKQNLLQGIPPYVEHTKVIVELLKMMQDYGLGQISYQELEREEEETRENVIIETSYVLSFIGQEETVIDFVGALNDAKQIIEIKELRWDYEIGKREDRMDEGSNDHSSSNDVKVMLKIGMYARSGQEVQEIQEMGAVALETYISEDSGEWQRPAEVQGIVVESVEDNQNIGGEKIEVERERKESEKDKISQQSAYFTLNIGGAMTPGDTYKLDGPGDKQEDYIGLSSNQAIKIGIKVEKQGYQMWMEDANGLRVETKVESEIIAPCLEIISTRRKDEGELPEVKIQIENATEYIMEVCFTGDILECITVLDKDETQLVSGETRGNLSLT